MCWKGYNLPYPDGAYETEFALLFIYLLIEPPRLFLGSKGNKTLTSGPLYASIVLAAYVLFMHIYYVAGQTFITRCDYAINVISIVFVSAQSLLALTQAVEVSRTLR
jgi:transmembrane protein 216|tara:strand:- start:569 stop:889 length:321 start_codon:yes stop_codon:yes gene_type:complete